MIAGDKRREEWQDLVSVKKRVKRFDHTDALWAWAVHINGEWQLSFNRDDIISLFLYL